MVGEFEVREEQAVRLFFEFTRFAGGVFLFFMVSFSRERVLARQEEKI